VIRTASSAAWLLRIAPLAAAAVLAGCGSKAPSHDDQCASIGDKLRSTKPPSAQPIVDKLLPAIVRSCKEDAWPSEVMDCFAKAPASTPELEACDRLLPKAIQDAITARQQPVK